MCFSYTIFIGILEKRVFLNSKTFNIMNYAIVEKSSKRAIAIVDGPMAEWFAQNLPIFDQKEIASVGSSSFTTAEGNISTISIQPKGTAFLREQYHLITNKPDTISLEYAYQLIL